MLSEGSYQKLNDFITLLRGLQEKEDLDAMIGVSGFKGFGKSTFSKQVLIRYVEKYMGVKKFTPSMLEKYTAYTGDDLFRLLDELPEYSPIDADETVNFAMGEDWMKSENKRLKKVMTKIRTKHHIFFFNIPDLWWLDKKYRENMISIWVHIVKKGHAMVSVPNTAPGVEDRWNRPWLIKKFTKNPIDYFTPLDNIMNRLRKYSCYKDDFAFPKLDAEIYQKHLELRDAKIMEVPEIEKLGINDLKWKAMCRNLGWHLINDGYDMNMTNIYELCKDPVTGEQPITFRGFTKLFEELRLQELKKENSIDT